MSKIHLIKDSHNTAIFMGEHDKMWNEGQFEEFLSFKIKKDQQEGKLDLNMTQSQIAMVKEIYISDMIRMGVLEIHE